MKTLRRIGMLAVLITASAVYASSDSQEAEQPGMAPSGQYEKLGLQNGTVIHMTQDEADESNHQAVEGFQKQLELSDPETRAAILKAQEDLQK